MLPTKFRFIWPSGFRGEDFLKSANQKQELPVAAMDRDEMSNLYRRPSIDASYQVSVQLAEGFQRRRLKCEKLTDDEDQNFLCCCFPKEKDNQPMKTQLVKQGLSLFFIWHHKCKVL